jgi:hypothetical protein
MYFPKFLHRPATAALEREPECRPYEKLPNFRLAVEAIRQGDSLEIAPRKPSWIGFALLLALVLSPMFILAIFIQVPLFLLILWGTVHPAVCFFLWRAYLAEYAGGKPYTRIDFRQKQIEFPRLERSFAFERMDNLAIRWLLIEGSDSNQFMYFLIAESIDSDGKPVLAALAFADAPSLLKKAHQMALDTAREHGFGGI